MKKILDEADTDPRVCKIKLVAESNTVAGGCFGASTIDMGDFDKLPKGIGTQELTQEAAIIHELVEQWYKVKNGARAFMTAHREALKSEAEVAGAKRASETTNQTGPGMGTVTFKYSN